MVKTIVRNEQGLRTIIKARDHSWVADEPEDGGGTDSGPMPTEMLLGALGACIAVTCRLYAERKGWPLEGVEVEGEMERFSKDEYVDYEGEAPFVYEFRQAVTFKGALTEEQRVKLAEIAGKCPVHRVLEYPSFFKTEVREEVLSESEKEAVSFQRSARD